MTLHYSRPFAEAIDQFLAQTGCTCTPPPRFEIVVNDSPGWLTPTRTRWQVVLDHDPSCDQYGDCPPDAGVRSLHQPPPEGSP